MSATKHREAWEGFWEHAPEEAGAVLWDAEPQRVAGRHLPLFREYFDAALPVADLGCGNGTQTRYLATQYQRVYGADLAAAAVGRAHASDPAGLASYRQLDATEPGAVGQLHAELGDVNVYMRGVLHQSLPEDRQPLVNGIATLVGERGRAFAVELSEQAGQVLAGLLRSGQPPVSLRLVMEYGIAPADVADQAVPEMFREAGLSVLASGQLPLATTEVAADGAPIELPSRWLVVGRAD
ncbi:methyltransferase domain-containing protein [Streptomyces sp. NPDC002851]